MSLALKRAVDILGATLALLLFLPFFIGISAAIYFSMGRPILFRQVRPGRHEVPFTLLKFRTMTEEKTSLPLADHDRLTPLGRFLRTTSLDELPEFWNVLKGDMSLVGPRPLLMDYLPYFTAREKRRHALRPGITGLAQVNGRNAVSWDDRLALDVTYVETRSIALDLRILFQTILSVARQDGINAPGHATMPRLDEERRSVNEKGPDKAG